MPSMRPPDCSTAGKVSSKSSMWPTFPPAPRCRLASADNVERRLADEVRARLEPTEPRWHFQPRDGSVAEELIAVADELRGERGPEANIVLVVGGPSRNQHHEIGGSVSLTLAEVDRFPLVVVP